MKDSTAWFVTEAARSQVGALYEHVFARIASGQSRHLVCPASDAQRRRIAIAAHRAESVGSPQKLAIADSPASAATASRDAARPQACDTPSHVGGRSIALEIVAAVDAGRHERSFVTMPRASCRGSSRFLGVEKSLR